MRKQSLKNLLLILFICIGINATAQKKWETKERNYTQGIVMSGLIDIAQAKLLGLKPIGKEVSINYDPFYDKYTINWAGEDGPARLVLKFSEENSGGKMYVDTYSSDTPYFVHDKIESDNKLTVIGANSGEIEGRKMKLVFIFDDLK